MEIQNSYLERKGPARFPRAPPGQAPRSASARPPSRGWGRPDKGLRGGVQLSRPLPSGAGGPPPASGGSRAGGQAAGGRPGLPAAYLRPTAHRRADTSLPGAGSGPGGGTEARRYGGGRSTGAASPSPALGGGAADGGRGCPRPGVAPGVSLRPSPWPRRHLRGPRRHAGLRARSCRRPARGRPRGSACRQTCILDVNSAAGRQSRVGESQGGD